MGLKTINMQKKKLLFIVNPISGGKQKKDLPSLIHQYLDARLFQYEILYTDYEGHGAGLARKHKDEFDILVAVGGDGTINEIAKELQASSTAMAIIPFGSGNGLSRFLKIPLKAKEAILALNSGDYTKIDTAMLNQHFFVSIAGVGFDSLIAAEFAKAPTRGFETYAKLSLQQYASYKEQEYYITINEETIKRKAVMISFANSDQFGYNTRIAPQANISDGLIEVCILRKPKLYQIPILMQQIGPQKRRNPSFWKLLELINCA
ncbi:MAG: diacylglycerol kinase [Bacteroidetes bacterium 4572_77]|nr:MAG: diacylglycerol kinase [Bacteroidetes bacterium 4572_77]